MRLRGLRAVLVVPMAAGLLAAPAALAGNAAAAEDGCIKIRVTGEKVPVRYDPHPEARIVRYVHRGDVLKTCTISIGRVDANGEGNDYHACGEHGYDWYWVKGGTIPLTCARKIG